MIPLTSEQINTALEVIAQADGQELTSLINALCEAIERRHPNNEAVFLTLPTDDPTERARILERFHEMMLRYHKRNEKDSLG